MAHDWNPNDPGTLGLEWLARLSGSVAIDASSKGVLIRVPSTAAETIAILKWYLALLTQTGRFLVEVFPADGADVDPATKTTQTFRPNEDVSGTGAALWREDDGTTATIFDQIDEAVLDVNDYIFTNNGAGLIYAGRMAVGAGINLVGRRILRVDLVTYWTAEFPWTVGTTSLSLGGTSYAPHAVNFAAQLLTSSWHWNPSTGRAWTIADVELLDTTDEWQVTSAGLGSRLFQAYLDVLSVPENRVAHGGESFSAAAWQDSDLFAPTGAANWAKAGAGNSYDVLIRRVSGDNVPLGIASPRYLDSGEAAPGGLVGYLPTIDADGIVTAYGDPLTQLPAMHMLTSAPGDGVDSQPYAEVREAQVYTGHDAEQEISAATAAPTYKKVRGYLVKPPVSGAATMDVKVKRRSDNVAMLGTRTVTAAEVAALPDAGNGWKLLDVEMPASGNLAAATQYYVEFSSAAATVAEGWTVLALDTVAVGETATYGGTAGSGQSDAATIAQAGGASTEDTQYDLPGTVQSVPATPANFAVAITSRDLPGDGSGCRVAAVEQAHLTWTATALGASFDHYEIERSDDGGVLWEQIAAPEPEATAAWDDLELRRTVPTRYRIRVVRTDGAQSDWSTTADVTAEAECCELIFVTNEQPDLAVAYSHPPGLEHVFPSSGERILVPIYYRDGFLSFRRLEDRYSGFDVSLYVFARAEPGDPLDIPPDGQGVVAFDSLRALADDPTLAYVCVLDSVGNRWLAELAVPRGSEDRSADVYMAPIVVTEIIRVPTVPISQ